METSHWVLNCSILGGSTFVGDDDWWELHSCNTKKIGYVINPKDKDPRIIFRVHHFLKALSLGCTFQKECKPDNPTKTPLKTNIYIYIYPISLKQIMVGRWTCHFEMVSSQGSGYFFLGGGRILYEISQSSWKQKPIDLGSCRKTTQPKHQRVENSRRTGWWI